MAIISWYKYACYQYFIVNLRSSLFSKVYVGYLMFILVLFEMALDHKINFRRALAIYKDHIFQFILLHFFLFYNKIVSYIKLLACFFPRYIFSLDIFSKYHLFHVLSFGWDYQIGNCPLQLLCSSFLQSKAAQMSIHSKRYANVNRRR